MGAALGVDLFLVSSIGMCFLVTFVYVSFQVTHHEVNYGEKMEDQEEI